MESFKLERDSKLKLQQVKLDGPGTVLDEVVKKEIMNMRIQHESLFEKVKLNSDKLVAIEIEVANIRQGDRNHNGPGSLANSPFADDIKMQ
jgi:hypothetical protein